MTFAIRIPLISKDNPSLPQSQQDSTLATGRRNQRTGPSRKIIFIRLLTPTLELRRLRRALEIHAGAGFLVAAQTCRGKPQISQLEIRGTATHGLKSRQKRGLGGGGGKERKREMRALRTVPIRRFVADKPLAHPALAASAAAVALAVDVCVAAADPEAPHAGFDAVVWGIGGIGGRRGRGCDGDGRDGRIGDGG